MKTHTNNGIKFGLQEVPEANVSSIFWIKRDFIYDNDRWIFYTKGEDKHGSRIKDNCDPIILGLASELSEEQARELVSGVYSDKHGYPELVGYSTSAGWHFTAKQALDQMINVLGMKPETTLIIKINEVNKT